jgi:hypothetical protein
MWLNGILMFLGVSGGGEVCVPGSKECESEPRHNSIGLKYKQFIIYKINLHNWKK